MSASEQTAALEGRMPVLPDERIFTNSRTFLASCTTFGAAIWIFMVGAGLSSLGDIRFAIPGYFVGMVIGFVPTVLSAGCPSFRYGLDPIDAAKATFGQRGAIVPLVGLIYVAIAWACVLNCFMARGWVTIANNVAGTQAGSSAEFIIAIATAVVTWLLVGRGPRFMESVNNIAAPCLVVLAAVLLLFLAHHEGWSNLWTARVPSTGWMFKDHYTVSMVAIELGIGSSLGAWPFLGGLTRLVANRRNIVTPSLLGITVVGLGIGSSVAAMVANALPTSDPILWFLQLGGHVVGGATAAAILLANVAVLGLFIYLAAVAAQQIGWVRRMGWGSVTALLLLPVVLAALDPDRILAAVLTINNYQGLVFVGIAGVSFANYFFVLKQRLDLRSIFAPIGEGRYAGVKGFNIPALISAVAGSAVYRMMFDPNASIPERSYGPLGAGVPALLVSAGLFLLLNRLLRRKAPSVSSGTLTF